MNMKRLLTLVAFFATVQASAQQVNPVPDYVFANRMSAGRNTVTDTAAYFSIGPRYGATRGMMPPMVVDTASFSANKRNGLLIFSVQKNKFLYWDSVGVKWAEMAGTGGTAISSGDTASMLAPYLRKSDTTAMLIPYIRHAGYGLIKSDQAFLVDSAALSTRSRVQKAVDSLAASKQNILTNPITGTGTTNTVTKFTSSTSVGNSGITEDGAKILYSGNLGLGTITSPNGKLDIGVVAGTSNVSATYSSTAWDDVVSNGTKFAFRQRFASYDVGNITMQRDGAESRGILSFNLSTDWSSAAPVEVFRITSAKEFFINTTTDAGDYKLQISGNIYNTGSITTGAPSGGSIKPWKIGEAATVSPTSPNRTIRVEIDGTVYYLHAKTTND